MTLKQKNSSFNTLTKIKMPKFTDLEAPNSDAIVSRRFSARTFAASRLFKCTLDRYRCRGCCNAAIDITRSNTCFQNRKFPQATKINYQPSA